MKYIFLMLAGTLLSLPILAQEKPEESKKLREVKINRLLKQADLRRLDSLEGTYIFSGKKSEVILIENKDLSVAEKYGRQIFSKVPGIFVYDMDGTGNQTNISTRGLDAHRGWEFNIRKDGVITNSDLYGYPASHYNIPLEAVEKIELVRGTASLQYGSQFGGMLNYVSKKPDSSLLAFQNISSVGSYGLLSSFNSISGTKGKFSYYAWFNKKTNSGYRKNSDSKYDAQNISLFYQFNPYLKLKVEWTRSNYVIHLAGQLTDQLFLTDPRSATRSRNYYNPEIHVPSISLDWKVSPTTQIKLTSSAILGKRNSVLFDKLANVRDTVNLITGQFASRQVDIDHFNSYTTEFRMLHSYQLFQKESNLTMGLQFIDNDLHRQQLGTGTTGTDYDLTLINPGYGRDMHLKTLNTALYLENRWALNENLSATAGLRLESGRTKMTGKIVNYPDEKIPNTIKHQYPLFGAGLQYTIKDNSNLYLGWSQAYRPVNFKDIIPGSSFETVDKNLKDAKGYNFEGGYRGRWNYLSWDLSYFQLRYNNRLGTVSQLNNNLQEEIYRTNIGDSQTRGLEIFTQADFHLSMRLSVTFFTATAYMDGRYQNAQIRNASTNTTVSITGNRIESVPEWISRNGVTLKIKNNSLSILHSYTAKSFADAINTKTPNATGTVGVVPAYNLFDINTGISLAKKLKLALNMNNVFDKSYYTKRPQFYPGPGIWPSDGRTFSTTIFLRL